MNQIINPRPGAVAVPSGTDYGDIMIAAIPHSTTILFDQLGDSHDDDPGIEEIDTLALDASQLAALIAALHQIEKEIGS
jgi:hypothetical protein